MLFRAKKQVKGMTKILSTLTILPTDLKEAADHPQLSQAQSVGVNTTAGREF